MIFLIKIFLLYYTDTSDDKDDDKAQVCYKQQTIISRSSETT